MRHDFRVHPYWLRGIALTAISALGIAAIVGSGGGWAGLPEFSDTPIAPPPARPPYVSISPSRITVQVGDTVQFRAVAPSATSYQWQRDGVDIAGATDSVYTWVGANLGDDGAHFSVVARNANGTTTATSLLQVSSLPPVRYEDGDFQMSNWSVSAIVEPASADARLSVTRSETGGDPDAFMQVSCELPPGPSSIRVLYTYLAETYDPAHQGAIYGVDMAVRCGRAEGFSVTAKPLLEQAGRRFSNQFGGICRSWWDDTLSSRSLRADEFLQVDGPECATGETCPDFSAQGAPIRFGIMTTQQQPSDPAKAISYGIDNWRVAVWRK